MAEVVSERAESGPGAGTGMRQAVRCCVMTTSRISEDLDTQRGDLKMFISPTSRQSLPVF